MATETLTTGQIIERLKARLELAELHHQAARIEINRKDAQIDAMMEELERLRAELGRCREANRGLWGELSGKGEGDG